VTAGTLKVASASYEVMMAVELVITALAVALVTAGTVLVWHLSGPRLATNVTQVSAPASISDCQRVIAENLGYKEDASGCAQELKVPWLRVVVRNSGHRTAPDFNCTLTAYTSYGQATVDLPRPGGIPGVPIPAGRAWTWVTYARVPDYADVQSFHAACDTIANPPI
jgi:hypothetical protein